MICNRCGAGVKPKDTDAHTRVCSGMYDFQAIACEIYDACEANNRGEWRAC